jgi:hypothetical protein
MSLSLLEPSGPVQACNEITLLLPLPLPLLLPLSLFNIFRLRTEN